jgi:hypothetical protein
MISSQNFVCISYFALPLLGAKEGDAFVFNLTMDTDPITEVYVYF